MTENKRMKKGSTSKENFRVIMFDLGCLDLKNTEDNKYRYDLLVGNLEDLFGRKIEEIEN
jgi:hypothetical protein